MLIFFIHIIDTIYMWIIVIFARYMCNNNNRCFTRQQNRRNSHVQQKTYEQPIRITEITTLLLLWRHNGITELWILKTEIRNNYNNYGYGEQL